MDDNSNWVDEVEYIMSNFDFEKVLRVMHFLDWRYFDSASRQVALDEIKAVARRHLESIQGNVLGGRSGGFKAHRETDEGFEFLRLSFEVASYESLYRPIAEIEKGA